MKLVGWISRIFNGRLRNPKPEHLPFVREKLKQFTPQEKEVLKYLLANGMTEYKELSLHFPQQVLESVEEKGIRTGLLLVTSGPVAQR